MTRSLLYGELLVTKLLDLCKEMEKPGQSKCRQWVELTHCDIRGKGEISGVSTRLAEFA